MIVTEIEDLKEFFMTLQGTATIL